MATIEEVARLAGVSVATVSRVLNKNYTVSEKRTRMVMHAIDQLGYEPNMVGRMLRTNASRTLLVAFSVLIPDLTDAIIETANEYGYDIVFSYCLPHLTNTKPLKPLYNGLVDGVILVNVMLDAATFADVCSRIPTVLCGDLREYDNQSYHRIAVDNEQMAIRMTTHLLEKGKRRIAYVGVRDEQGMVAKFSTSREKGFMQALAEHGASFDPKLSVHVMSDFAGGRKAADYLIEQGTLPEAIFCFTDTLAIGCISRLAERGIRVPEDVLVAGFDNVAITEQFIPSITTVAQPFREMGAECVRRLVLPDAYPEASEHIVEGRLVLRTSTGDV